ncbi:hypothetical protein ABZP36_008703 [Zizania latifolia]
MAVAAAASLSTLSLSAAATPTPRLSPGGSKPGPVSSGRPKRRLLLSCAADAAPVAVTAAGKSESRYDDSYIRGIEREILLKTLDTLWKDRLVNMNKLSSVVNVRSFGHRNPLEEHKIDGREFFISMLSATRRLTVVSLLKYWSSPMESEELFNTEDQ